ncbi:MAG: arylsulfatase [Betaproteobacteria bacterium]|nr:arylsulfatase [Betaproteobacteria bacterium]
MGEVSQESAPGPAFPGVIGRTLADSRPHWPAPTRAAPGSPNVVVILMDDMGYSDLGCFGGDIDTPRIDALAANGVRFTGYTTVPMCTPARAALLTGKNPHSVGCGWLSQSDPGYPGYRGEISADAPTMAELLRARGYATLAAGKWHNTYDRNNLPGGDTSSWPIQRGFDQFYGFMGPETSYFQPDNMMEGNHPANVVRYPEGYFAPDDYTGRAVEWLAHHFTSSPDKPFFLYLAFQTPHGPLHAKPADLARYRGRFDAGWDAMRRGRFDRQLAAGLIEPNAGFAPRNPGVPEWAALGADERALYARYMEVYAALLDNADQNVGRLVDFLRDAGQLDNTLILLTSDNGANAVAGPRGVMNLVGRRVGAADDMALNLRLLAEDRVGAEDTYVCYPTGWTQLSNTPYRYFKRLPMAGGIRVPLVAHWPARIGGASALRRQWVHVTDLLPTVMEFAGASLPAEFKGRPTRALDGKSFARILEDGEAPARRDRQYYELQGNRAYISGNWKIVSLQTPDRAIDLDNWMLFDLDRDPAEIDDLAKAHPDIVRRLVEEFDAEAGANFVYPIDTRDERRNPHVPPHEVERMLAPRDFYRVGQAIPSLVVSPLVCDRDYVLKAWFEWTPGDEGIIFALGDRFCGLVLYVDAGALHCIYQWWHAPTLLKPVALAAGRQAFELRYRATGKRQGCADVVLNGEPRLTGADLSPTMLRVPTCGMSIGLSRRLSVSERYAHRGDFRYGGHIERVRIEPGALAPGSSLEPSEEVMQARMRAPA